MGSTSPSIRNSEVNELLQYGIQNYETVVILKKDEIIKDDYIRLDIHDFLIKEIHYV